MVRICELLFSCWLHLKHYFKVSRYGEKKSLLILCLYIFVSVGLHRETNVYWFPNNFSKSSISYAKIMYLLSKLQVSKYLWFVRNIFDFSKYQWSVFRHYLVPTENTASSDLSFPLYSYKNQATWFQYKHEKTPFFYRSKWMLIPVSYYSQWQSSKIPQPLI